MKCRSSKCGSTNIQLLSSYWASLPSDSSLKKDLAQPAAVESQALWALAVVLVGILALVSGAVPAGLALAVGGGLWVAAQWRRTETAAADRAAWESKRRCLACTETWVP
jgi:hypothetical protein